MNLYLLVAFFFCIADSHFSWLVCVSGGRCSASLVGFAGSSDVSCTEHSCKECGATLLSVDLTKVHNHLLVIDV